VSDLVGARAAVTADLDVTSGFSQLARDEVADDRGGRWLIEHDLSRLPRREHHQLALDSVDRYLVVGTIDGTVVGHALAELCDSIDSRLCMVEELYVHPEARGIGVGSEMLALVRAWARETNCEAIESHVLPGNRSGKNFFERIGMKTRKMRVSADL
jgi:GNAT superfamily N-acetyltransferase